MSHREETPGKTQDTLERLCLSAGLGTPRTPPGRAGGSVWGEGSLGIPAEAATPATRERIKREKMNENLNSARCRQKRNYDKNRRDIEFQPSNRVWIRAHPLSKAEKSFTAKLAPKWQGPYRVVQQVGPVNYQVVLEDSGQDLKVVHVSRLKPCYPSAQEMEERERKRVLEIFLEDSEEEDFLGFPDTTFSASRGGWDGSGGRQEDDYPDCSSESESDPLNPSVI
ncbi:uncharacterized protein LOC133454734 [Cololabis saira]|uniref:uncharacterized protein LOC133454734 n=1 Tax=Cololabis saira TaxID=129043 RepID=UPI002AD20BF4|nr:uncharacterized protein LOC133454734 [Cololabis saira]